MSSAANVKQSCMKRFGREMPVGDPVELARFVKYAKHLFEDLLDRVQLEEVASSEEWLRNADYPVSRKIQILRDYNRFEYVSDKMGRVKAFIKNEPYLQWKACRTINSPSDASKLLLAPLIHACDKRIFALPYFVKGSAPSTWPARLRELFGEDKILTTDFTAMESHHLGQLNQVVYGVYKHLLSGLGLDESVDSLLEHMFVGDRDITFEQARVSVDERLMSGTQWTSGANSILNFALISYVMSHGKAENLRGRTLWVRSNFKGLFEGDDGIFSDTTMDAGVVQRLGLLLKFEPVAHVEMAGFCGMYLAPDSDSILKDSHKVLAEFFRLALKFKNQKEASQHAMLRARALSYAFQFADCPIIGPLAFRILSLTKSVDVRAMRFEFNSYQRDIFDKSVESSVWDKKPKITAETRVRYEDLFGFTIKEQLYVEECISDMTLEGGHCDLTHRYEEHDWEMLNLLFNGPPTSVPVEAYIENDYVETITRKKAKRKGLRPVIQNSLPPLSVEISGRSLLY